ncbi:MAG: EamA family transporter [Bacteroidales bacterium]|nr:EamA family transporter [Bacteroidales bacterium]MDD4256565.1 EamA family transporter [Bacteroidales bacterium]MDD4654391.1 EamA family transporter [Bacteroidales bacterium]MDD4827472.1 EamA family transporter [Bacteroidales bacterium]
MLRFILLSLLQCVLLTSGQVSLKLAMGRMEAFSFKWIYFKHLLTNWYFVLTGIFFVLATVLWMHILKHFPFSLAYPITSISYVFGMIAAYLIFHETIPLSRWIGVLFIMAGVFFLVKQ